MDSTVFVSVLSVIGTLIGSFGGIMAANKLTNYRIAELEKKVDKHNTIIERTYAAERDLKTAFTFIDELREEFKTFRDEVKQDIKAIKNDIREIREEEIKLSKDISDISDN